MAETEKFETIRYTADVIALTPAREVLLIQRGRPPDEGAWALPGVHWASRLSGNDVSAAPHSASWPRPTGIRPSRTSTTNWDAGHDFELVS